MSKIQDALDKIKAAKDQDVLGTAVLDHTEDRSNHTVTATNHHWSESTKSNNISKMYQPDELTSEEKARMKIIGATMSDRQVFNAFRDLRTTVTQRTATVSAPIIMLTSCSNHGGTSFVAQNLATAIAMDESKTSLLIDCNLSDPNFTKLSITDANTGLKNYLKDLNCSINEVIHPTGIPRMRVIPAGSLDLPMIEYFTNVRLRNLFDDIKQRYKERYIIVDAPPIAENADARILAQVCDFVILVVPYGKVTDQEVLSSARAIGKEKLLGTVFNNQPRTPKFSWK